MRNAFRPQTVDELHVALDQAHTLSDVGCVLLMGNGPSPKDGGSPFCSGGDQRIRGADGYRYESPKNEAESREEEVRLGRLHILEAQRRMRFMPSGHRGRT